MSPEDQRKFASAAQTILDGGKALQQEISQFAPVSKAQAGGTNLRMGVRYGRAVVEFDEPVKLMALNRAQATEIGRRLIKMAKELPHGNEPHGAGE